MSRPLDPTERQRLLDSTQRVERAMRDLFHAGPHWQDLSFPGHAAAVLGEAARVLAAERWHMLQCANEESADD